MSEIFACFETKSAVQLGHLRSTLTISDTSGSPTTIREVVLRFLVSEIFACFETKSAVQLGHLRSTLTMSDTSGSPTTIREVVLRFLRVYAACIGSY